jgi:hypothetical protein
MPSPGTKRADQPGGSERQRGADINRDRALKGDQEARRKDPHGQSAADTADQDEPKAWPSPDRQKVETTSSRVGEEKAGKR